MLYVFRRGMEVCCHVCAKDERDMRRVNIRTRKSFPFGETNNKQNIIIVVVAFLFEEKTKRERERERDPSEKRRPKRIIVITVSYTHLTLPTT